MGAGEKTGMAGYAVEDYRCFAFPLTLMYVSLSRHCR